eukprot:764308-Hanusia_phi.AAC.5
MPELMPTWSTSSPTCSHAPSDLARFRSRCRTVLLLQDLHGKLEVDHIGVIGHSFGSALVFSWAGMTFGQAPPLPWPRALRTRGSKHALRTMRGCFPCPMRPSRCENGRSRDASSFCSHCGPMKAVPRVPTLFLTADTFDYLWPGMGGLPLGGKVLTMKTSGEGRKVINGYMR